MPSSPTDERRVTSRSRGEESGFIKEGGITQRKKREDKTSNEKIGTQAEKHIKQ
jgi:hypothetical protein